MATSANRSINVTSLLLFGAGVFFVAVALIYNNLVDDFVSEKLLLKAADRIWDTRLNFLIIGVGFIIIALLARRFGNIWAWLHKPLTINILISVLTLAIPFMCAELALKPFATRGSTTIFMRDEARGWRLQPNAESTWGGIPVKINSKGLRGPEISYDKPDDVFRILYLGDSVTFGFLIEDDADTFPAQIETRLEALLSQNVETVNAGVGGYSPWQEYLYFADEGLKYEPDLVVVSFILNDVTEKFELVRFGGGWEGYQVTHTAFSTFDLWAGRSSILYFLKRIGIQMSRSEAELQQRVVQQAVDVETLAREPDNPNVQDAWALTLENLGKIFDLAETHDIPIVLVVFPFTFQFEDIEALSAPQAVVTQFANEHGVPALDLLPLLDEAMAQNGLTTEDYFFDEDHPTHYGSEVVAEMIVTFLQEEIP